MQGGDAAQQPTNRESKGTFIIMAYSYVSHKSSTTYYLHSRTSANGATLYYFAKVSGDGTLDAVPDGYVVSELPNGLPVLKRTHTP
jgi:hypothetical protein